MPRCSASRSHSQGHLLSLSPGKPSSPSKRVHSISVRLIPRGRRCHTRMAHCNDNFEAAAPQSFALHHLNLPPNAGFQVTVSKSPTPNQASDVGSYLSGSSTINNSHRPAIALVTSPHGSPVFMRPRRVRRRTMDLRANTAVLPLVLVYIVRHGFWAICDTFPYAPPEQCIH